MQKKLKLDIRSKRIVVVRIRGNKTGDERILGQLWKKAAALIFYV